MLNESPKLLMNLLTISSGVILALHQLAPLVVDWILRLRVMSSLIRPCRSTHLRQNQTLRVESPMQTTDIVNVESAKCKVNAKPKRISDYLI